MKAAEILTLFSQVYFKNYYLNYRPSIKDKVAARRMLEDFGEFLAPEMIRVFFEFLHDHPNYRNAPPTLSCLYYNRADIGKKLFEEGVEKKVEVGGGMF